MDWTNPFGSNQRGGLAPYPQTNYPFDDFVGGASSNLQAATTTSSTTAAGKVDPQDKMHTIVVILAIVAAGYVVWHWNTK